MSVTRRFAAVVALTSVALMASGCGSDDTASDESVGDDGTPAASASTSDASDQSKVPTLDLDGGEFYFDTNGVTSVPAGSLDVNFTNVGEVEDHIVMFLKPKDGHTTDEVIEAANGDFTGLAAQPLADYYGGVNAVPPGGSQTSRVELTPGTYVVGCFIPSQADLQPHSMKGMVTTLEVTEPEDGGDVTFVEPPEVDGTIDQADFSFMVPEDFDGQGTWKVTNSGTEIHELGIAKLDDGVTIDGVEEFFSKPPVPPAPFVGAGGFGASGPDIEGYIFLDLEPGNYAMVCLVGDPNSKKLHLALGMAQAFTVT